MPEGNCQTRGFEGVGPESSDCGAGFEGSLSLTGGFPSGRPWVILCPCSVPFHYRLHKRVLKAFAFMTTVAIRKVDVKPDTF